MSQTNNVILKGEGMYLRRGYRADCKVEKPGLCKKELHLSAAIYHRRTS